MKIVAWNCRGLGNRPAVQGLLDLQKSEKADILFLSETKLDEWSTNVLGDLEISRKRLKRELKLCRRGARSKANIEKEGVLQYRLEKVENQIDTYWRQRAHVKWMQYGDRNTAYFHAACSERKRSNRIGTLRKDDGGWVEEEGEKRSFISNYFATLFRSSGNRDNQRLLNCVHRKVTPAMNNDLTKPYTRVEVVAALKSIGNLKAPGPDGMPALFYKEYWDEIGEKVTGEVL
ncbi:uncharacterized protein LOC110434863 [Sorghum bicolor]|uniref:uncharacterized protein LOC110434863 n=1 Tax=Sorghum bicolor TaxID=4558 RepID=UPI000B424F01|nr:uncharacterized protein LOC110434863 [Sorghum bicolor]|eukprot:XP_021315303.1 uncharacterized protein LOC110434863 [Sorghum bicolor]